jgi:hypothetical protein
MKKSKKKVKSVVARKPKTKLKAKKKTEAPVVEPPKPKFTGTRRKEVASKPSHYVDKKELYDEVVLCQKKNKFTEKLAEMFGKMIEGVSHRFPNLQYYAISDDVKQDCHLLLLQKYKNFNAELNTSCFAFFTTVIFNQMRYQLTRAKRYKDHRDHMVNAVVEYIEEHKHNFIDTHDEDEY